MLKMFIEFHMKVHCYKFLLAITIPSPTFAPATDITTLKLEDVH